MKLLDLEQLEKEVRYPLETCRQCGEPYIAHPNEKCKMFIPLLTTGVEGLER